MYISHKKFKVSDVKDNMKHPTRSIQLHHHNGDATSSVDRSGSSILNLPPKVRAKKQRTRSSSSKSKTQRRRKTENHSQLRVVPEEEEEEKYDHFLYQERPRSVCFSPEVRIRRIPNRKDLSDGDCCLLYMNKSDFERIEDEIENLILHTKKDSKNMAMMAKYMELAGEQHELLDDDEESKKDFDMLVNEDDGEEGVEVVSHKDSNSESALDGEFGDDDEDNYSLRGLEMWMSSSRQEIVDNIIQETLRHQAYGLPDVMAAVYRNCATPCAHAAYMTALLDEQQARDFSR